MLNRNRRDFSCIFILLITENRRYNEILYEKNDGLNNTVQAAVKLADYTGTWES